LTSQSWECLYARCTFTNLYNQRPHWVDQAHLTLDASGAAAYGWDDYTLNMSNEEILRQLLALNLERPLAGD